MHPPSAVYSGLYPVIEDAQHIIDQALFMQMKDKAVGTCCKHEAVWSPSALVWP